MQLPTTLYTARCGDAFVGGVVNARTARSFVFGFEKRGHMLQVCKRLAEPHSVLAKGKRSLIITPDSAAPKLDIARARFVRLNTAELLAHTYMNNTRVFVVRRVLAPPDSGGVLVLTTDLDPSTIQVDHELLVQNMNELLELEGQ